MTRNHRFRLAVCTSSFALFFAGFVACGNSTFQSEATDGGTDATTSDAATSDVGVTDATPPDASFVDPCPGDSGFTVCDDFDKATIRGIWGPDPKCVNPTLDTLISISPPHSLHANNELADASVRSCSYFAAAAATSKSRVHCEVDLKIGIHPNALFTFVEFTTNFDAISYHQLDISYDGTNPSSTQPFAIGEATVPLDGGGASQDVIIPADQGTIDGWFHVVFDVDYAMGMVTANVAGITKTMMMLAKPSSGTVSQADLRVGFTQNIDAGITNVNYDNVFCEAF